MNNFIKLYLLSSLSLSFISAETTKFGLGSCLDQDYPQPIWEAIEKEDLDYFVFLGDNIYGDLPSGSLRKMVSAYKKQKNNFPEWMQNLEILPIWDDHDYGLNDAGSEYPLKRQSQEIYLNFWEIPLDDERHNRDGIYFSEEKIIQGKVFKLIFLKISPNPGICLSAISSTASGVISLPVKPVPPVVIITSIFF